MRKRYVVFKCNYKMYGNDYGGYYICSEILNQDEKEIIVYSAGIGKDISFDLDILKAFDNCKVFAFDPTPTTIEWLGQQDLPDNFIFSPYGISSKTGEETMYFPKIKDHDWSAYKIINKPVDNEIIVQMKRIEDIMKENSHKYIDILKMDIEGSEFSIIENLNYSEINCGQITLEFHKRFFKNGRQMFTKAINTLQANGYYCFAVAKKENVYSFIRKSERFA